jgi:hypothetical protein
VKTASLPAISATSGPALFARYAYPPNERGYCGPDDAAALLGAGASGSETRALAHLARQFEGAWPYLELIAGCNGVADPLDYRVVEAYWVGNALTRRVSALALAASLEERFSPRLARGVSNLAHAAFNGGVAQHDFHVFAVYPWLGLLREGHRGAPLEVLDRCRIRWGRVADVAGDVVAVSSQPLEFVGSRLVLGPPRLELARRALDGVGFVDGLRVGDAVSLHWDWVCDRLDARSLSALRAATRENLRAVNTLRVPGPAVAAGAWS